MTASFNSLAAEPFFLKSAPGDRFCLYHRAASQNDVRGAFVYLHPFAEEMNKSRRMAALQARAFARAGYNVLQIDLFGCGDSSGDFSEARWELWKEDVDAAVKWLKTQTTAPIGLWGLRMGAMLALAYAMESTSSVSQLLLWQPIISGESYLTQFLRLRMATEMLNGETQKISTQDLRKLLAAGQSLEIGGYELSPALASSIDTLNLANFAIPALPVHWIELIPEADRPMPPASARSLKAWELNGVDLHLHMVPGPAFWAAQEITECHQLIKVTTSIFEEVVT
jgi:exosortase A-associated hydrolase 2